MKLNKDQLTEIAAGIGLDKKYYEDKSNLTVLKNLRKHIDGQEDYTLQYELLSKLKKVLDRSTQRAVLQKSCCTVGILLGKLIQFYLLAGKMKYICWETF